MDDLTKPRELTLPFGPYYARASAEPEFRSYDDDTQWMLLKSHVRADTSPAGCAALEVIQTIESRTEQVKALAALAKIR